MGFLRTAVTSSLLVAGHVAAIEPIVAKGSKFFLQSGEQFYIQGVAYQQEAGTGPGGKTSTNNTYVDPLSDVDACKRDVKLLKDIKTNIIRTYAIDPTADHSGCMKELENAGIYVVADLGEPATSINRDDPNWNVKLFDRYKAVIDELGQYDNVLGFFAGNEVTNNATNTNASAYVKAAVRDTKKYIADKMANGHRWMGVGYAANDDAEIRTYMAQYFNCGPEEEAIDFWGYNIYSWCGKSTFEDSGYDVQVEFFSNYSVPVFFAEYGCNSPGGAEGRLWDDTVALYSDEMTGVFNGGIVYMFHQEENDYGLVKVTGDTAKPLKNYDTLKKAMNKISPNKVQMGSYTPANQAAECPAVGDSWEVSTELPPTPDSSLCDCMYNSISCAPADSLKDKEFGDIFDYICDADADACAGIKGDTASGVYGPYVMCNPKQKLGHVLDAYYQNQGTDDACDFKGKAQKVQGKSDASCSAALASASAAADVAATATAGSPTGGATESGNAAAGRPAGPFMTGFGLLMGLYMVVAGAVGAGMIML